MVLTLRNLQLQSRIFFFLSRGKKKLAFRQYRRKDNPAEVAKDYFDLHYRKIFQGEWPAIRCAMLSRKKYCSVVNNFSDYEEYKDNVESTGAYDFISKLRGNAQEKSAQIQFDINELKENISNQSNCAENDVEHHSEKTELVENIEKLEQLQNSLSICNELQKTCMGVNAYVYPQADFTEFEETIKDSLHLSFFLDASSVLPVLALDPRPGDQILDMCAAPGGKLNVMMQATGGSAYIIANDSDSKRTMRIKKILREYVPKDSEINQHVKVVNINGTEWTERETEAYTKVLVDVPCTTDRVSMYETAAETDNIFCTVRKRERGRLPELQFCLLKNAVLACQPGGTVVYSTCTISPLQNEFVVQHTVQHLFEEYEILCEIEDLSILTSLLEDEFHFQQNPVLGALVIPRLSANFGPTFICKLRRIT